MAVFSQGYKIYFFLIIPLEFCNIILIFHSSVSVLQYGFVTIFVCAFPLAPLFALINNIFEIRIDAKKYLFYYQRPVAQRVKNIGVWLSVMDIIGKLSVASNAFIIAFTSNFIPKLLYYKHVDYNVTKNLSTSSYLDFKLAYFDTNDFEMKPNMSSEMRMCRYEAFRYPPWDSEQRYKRLPLYWEMFTYKLGFVVAYTYLAYIIAAFIEIIIPDVPKKLEGLIKRETYELRDILIEKNPLRSSVSRLFNYLQYFFLKRILMLILHCSIQVVENLHYIRIIYRYSCS